jgi:hypothetical protein
MRTLVATVAAAILALGASGAAAQEPPVTVLQATQVPQALQAAQAPQPLQAPPAVHATPRVELGGGLAAGIAVSSEGAGGFPALANARVGVAINPTWAIEGVFDIWPESADYALVLYRAQARWQFAGGSKPGALRAHLTFGATGMFEHEKYDGWEWRSPDGTLYSVPGYDRWNGAWPIYPTVGIGVQKVLGAHIALRADVAAVAVYFDDGAGLALLPSISVSFPIGRYARHAQ